MRPSRRKFLQYSGAALTTGLVEMNLPSNPVPKIQSAPELLSNKGKKPLRLGLILGVEPNPDAAMAALNNLGIPTCQVYLNNFDPAFASRLRKSLDAAG